MDYQYSKRQYNLFNTFSDVWLNILTIGRIHMQGVKTGYRFLETIWNDSGQGGPPNFKSK